MTTPRCRSLTLAALVAGLAPLTTAQDDHLFYNLQKTQFATRGTITDDDTIYFTQPFDFRNNGEQAIGWRVVIQDENQSTAEQVRLSWHQVAPDGVTPIATEIAGQSYVLFGVGSGVAAYIFTLSTNTATTLPQQVALGIFLPKPHPWQADATTLHYQRGDNTLVPPSSRAQWTYVRLATSPFPQWVPGSTFRWGGIYKAPVCQIFTSSNGYNAGRENLYGPESLFPDPTRGDLVGIRFSGQRFRSLATQLPSVAVMLIGWSYRTPPSPTPFGPLLVTEPWLLIYPILLGLDGSANVGPVPISNPPIPLGIMAGFVNLHTQEIAFSNAAKIKL